MKCLLHKVLVIALCGISSMACTTKKQPAQKTTSVSEKSVIKINITQTSSYCGGAYPPDELMMELRTPKKLPNQKVYIRPGTTNDWNVPIVAEGISDINGVVTVELVDGTYSVVFENKVNTSFYKQLLQQFGDKPFEDGGIDKNCLEKFMQTAEAVFEVNNGKTATAIIVNVHNPCSWERIPCLPFDGNLPPSAPPPNKQN